MNVLDVLITARKPPGVGSHRGWHLPTASSCASRSFLTTIDRALWVRRCRGRPMVESCVDSRPGNARAFAIVNLPLTVDTLHAALTDIPEQMRAIAEERPDYALPTLTQNAGGPWLYKRLGSIAIMSALRPDLDVGLKPLYVTMETAFGVRVDAVFPFSPLVYTPVSLAALILGEKLTIGINSDASAAGNLGEVLARELGARLLHARTAYPRDVALDLIADPNA